MHNLFRYILFLLLIIVTFFSCKTTSKTTQIEAEKQSQQQQNKLSNYGIGKLLDSVSSKYLLYNNISIKINVIAELFNESHQLEGILRIKKDSIISISLLAPLGIEAAKIILYADSILFINKFKKEYFIRPYSFFEQQFQLELTFNDIQSILTNQLFLYSETDEERNLAMNEFSSERDYIKKTFFKDKDSVNYILKTHRKHKIKRYLKKPLKDEKSFIVENIKIVHNQFKIQAIEVIDYSEKRSLLVEYSNFETINNTLFPTMFNFTAKDSTQQFVLKLMYKKINLNQELNFSINIPSTYKKIY